MLGLIQKVFVNMLRDLGGEEKLTEIKALAGIPQDKEFMINKVYDDEEWQRFLAAGIKVLNITQEQAEEAYAEYFGADSLNRFPTWFQMCKNSHEFLMMQPTIHNCFASSVADQQSRQAISDKFSIDKKGDDHILIHYRSPNKHCGIYTALAKWIANHYKDEIIIEHDECMRKGAKECKIHIHFLSIQSIQNTEGAS